MHDSTENPAQARALYEGEEVAAMRGKFGLLGSSFSSKRADVERLIQDVREAESKFISVRQQWDGIHLENNHVDGLLEVKRMLIAEAELGNKEEEENTQQLRDEIKNVSEAIMQEKSNGIVNLCAYENQVRAMSDLFLNRRQSYEESKLKSVSKDLEEKGIFLRNQFEVLNGNFQRVLMRKENVENSYMQIHGTVLGETQNLVGEYMKKAHDLYTQNQILQNKIENIERYVKDVAS